MPSVESYLVLGALALIVALQIVLLFRKSGVALAPDQHTRLAAFEQNLQASIQSISRVEGATTATSRQLDKFTESTSVAMEVNKKTLDEKLQALVVEGRASRQELLVAFQGFEAKVDQKVSGLQETLSARFVEFQQSLTTSIEAGRKGADEALRQTFEETRAGRGDLMAGFGAFETRIEQRFSAFDVSISSRFEALRGGVSSRLDEIQQATSGLLKELSDATLASRDSASAGAMSFQAAMQERINSLAQSNLSVLESLKQGVLAHLGATSTALHEQLNSNANQSRNQFSALQDAVAQQLQLVSQGSNQSAEQLRATLNERLAAIQSDNATKLEEMRLTVDEKLHATLEQRLGDSFKLVSERLEQVHSGLGEMRTLAGNVGDLKRVMTNVRARGTWGEVQLGSIIEGLLTTDQYQRNVKPIPDSNEVVEFAVRMPGKSEDSPLWLPIDSKYPVEDYQRLADAYDSMDKAAIEQATSALEASIRAEAKKISSKYISPPHTTDFAVMFVPTEGLFAEVLRIPGLSESLQNLHRVVLVGPTNFAAMLNSLRLGFRTLAIEKRSSEVWGILGTVKTEFRKFGEIVESTKKSIDAAANKFVDLGRRTRAIDRSLQEVQELPPTAAPAVALIEALGLPEVDVGSGTTKLED